MRVAQVVGTVTLSRCHPSFTGATLKMAIPLSLEELVEDRSPAADPLVVYDQFGADVGSRIMLSEGTEAARPFRPRLKPVDAYNAGILDDVVIRRDALPWLAERKSR